MGIRFSESTIRAGFLVQTPNWYVYNIAKHLTKAAESGSTNHIYIFEGQNGEMKGVPISKLINEKADWIALPLFKAALGGQDPSPDKEYNWEDLVGLTIEAYTKRGARQDGSPMNDLVDFAPLGTNTK